MSNKKPAVRIGAGEFCPKCKNTMLRFEHANGWRPKPGRGYFAYWDRCTPCGHLQHYEAGRVKPEPSLFEVA